MLMSGKVEERGETSSPRRGQRVAIQYGVIQSLKRGATMQCPLLSHEQSFSRLSSGHLVNTNEPVMER